MSNVLNFAQNPDQGRNVDDKMGSVFPDAAILDIQFNIVSINQNILAAPGYSSEEVQGRSVSIFSLKTDFKTLLKNVLRTGSFEAQPFDMRCKDESILTCTIAGFYTGPTADIKGLIILKFRDIQDTNLNGKERVVSTKELDDFIYATSHSLRGPLATLRGLINLASRPGTKEEFAFLVSQMNVFADRLDEKLHQLIYVAELDKSQNPVSESLSLKSICQSLSSSVLEASVDYPINFHCPVPDQAQMIENGDVILTMLNNLALFFSQQPKTRQNTLIVDALANSSATEIVMHSKGFLFSDSLIKKIENVNFGYAEILNFPELINYYAAKKIMIKLKGSVQFMLIDSNEVVVLMTVPKDSARAL